MMYIIQAGVGAGQPSFNQGGELKIFSPKNNQASKPDELSRLRLVSRASDVP